MEINFNDFPNSRVGITFSEIEEGTLFCISSPKHEPSFENLYVKIDKCIEWDEYEREEYPITAIRLSTGATQFIADDCPIEYYCEPININKKAFTNICF